MIRRLVGACALLLALSPPVHAQQVLVSGSLTAANVTVKANPNGAVALNVSISGTFSGTVTFQCDPNGGGTYTAINATALDTGIQSTTTTATGVFSLPNVGCVSVQANMTAYTSGTAVITITRGFLSARAPTERVIDSQVTGLGSTAADTNETDIYTYTVKANTLSANGKEIRATVFGSFGNNGNNKTLKLYWNGTNIATIGPTASTNSWRVEIVVARSSTTNAKVKGFAVYGTVTSTGGNLALTSDWTTAMIIKVTGTNGSANAADISGDFGYTEALN